MKPRFSHCTPQLPVSDLEATLEYYRDKLGFTDGWKFGERDGGASRDGLRMLFAEDKEFVQAVNNKDKLTSDNSIKNTFFITVGFGCLGVFVWFAFTTRVQP